MFLVGTASSLAQDPEIQSFGGNGQLVFQGSTNEQWYSIEWAATMEGPWANSWAGLGYIPSAGSGLVTTAVPMFYRVVGHMAPTNMALIPAGTFDMGDTLNDGDSDERPVHSVSVDGFYVDRFEVTKALWDEVHHWALTNGYSFGDIPITAKGPDHPITGVSWYDAVKWCNARSQMEGLPPVYYQNVGNTALFVGGQYSLSNTNVDWNASGYRLPTEAEWEKAARGGNIGMRFPWTDWTNCISFTKANYYAWSQWSYDLDDGRHPIFGLGEDPSTSPVGYFAPNDYGLYDMAGNTSEWCWDVYDPDYYIASAQDNPRGPDGPGSVAVQRGGCYIDLGVSARCAARQSADKDMLFYPGTYPTGGFRCVRRQ